MNDATNKNNDNVINVDGKLSGLKRHAEELNKLVTESLNQALFELMAEKPYNKITITELCDRAGVSRAAFYGNYASKDDIIVRVVNAMNDEVLQKVGSPFRSYTSEKWYAALFEYVRSRAFVYKSIMAAGLADRYMQLLNEKILHDPNISDEKKYQRIIWSGGIQQAVSYWIECGMDKTVEQMAKLCADNLVSWSI